MRTIFGRSICILAVSLVLSLFIAVPQDCGAATWSVNAKMTLSQLQGVIDAAADGDTILFEKGAYDFSSAEFHGGTDYVGALNVVDKSLIFVAKKGVIVKGTPSELDESGIGTRGVVAFVFKNVDRDKDVVVRGFSFKTMLMAVCVYGCRHVDIQGCSLSEIDRNGLATVGAGGNITLMDNQIASRRSGLFLDWYWFSPSNTYYQTRGTQLMITGNTTTTVGNFKGYIGGIYVCRSSEGQIAGNTVSANAGYGIYINEMAPDSSASRLFISKNTIQGPDYGVRVSLGSGIQIENNKVSDSDYGLYLASSWNNRVVGNNLIDVVNSGISILGRRCTQNQVIGNQIDIIGPPGWTPDIYAYGIITTGNQNTYTGNAVSGTGSAAFFVFSNEYATGHNEVFECNSAKNFKPAAAHYIFFNATYDNRFSETWTNGVFYLDYGVNNVVTYIVCK